VQDDYDDAVPLEPDHDSSLVWSTDAKKRVQALLDKNGGNVNESLKKLFGGCTSYERARELSEAFAEGFGLSAGQFMFRYYKWRRGEL